ncbi:MAG: hypothetical protein QXV81_03035 [Ignisphaera sp.]
MTITQPVGKMMDPVKNTIRKHISTRAPGLLEILNLYSLNIHGKEILTLLIESPCTVYRLLYQLYKDRAVATAIMANLFIAPLSTIENPSIHQFFLNKLKECIDKEP